VLFALAKWTKKQNHFKTAQPVKNIFMPSALRPGKITTQVVHFVEEPYLEVDREIP